MPNTVADNHLRFYKHIIYLFTQGDLDIVLSTQEHAALRTYAAF